MLALAREMTVHSGYEQYEISNFSRPGRRCRHNLDCWNLREYRGFGAGAHSFLRAPAPLRLANTPDSDDYVLRVGSGGDAVAMREEPTPRQFAGEALMLGLRTADGVDETAFALAHGASPAALFPEAAALGAEKAWIERSSGQAALHRNRHPLLERNLPPALLTIAPWAGINPAPATCRVVLVGEGLTPSRAAATGPAPTRCRWSLLSGPAENPGESAPGAVSARPPCS